MRISDWSSDVCSSDLVAGMTGIDQHDTNVLQRHNNSLLESEQKAYRKRLPIRHLPPDRKSVVSGKSVSVRVDLGGRRVIKKQRRQADIQKCVYRHEGPISLISRSEMHIDKTHV